MKYFFLLTTTIISILHFSTAAMDVFVVSNRYYTPDAGSYVETDILIRAQTVKFVKNENQKFQAAIEVSLIYKQNNEVVAFDKYILKSVEIADTNDVKMSIIDRKRFTLPTGASTLEAIFKDQNSTEQKTVNETFIIDEQKQSVFISDILLIDNFNKTEEENIFTKSGFQIIPYVLNFFPESKNTIGIYAEIYNTDKIAEGNQVLVNYSINKYKTDEVANYMKRYVKMNVDAVNVVLSEFDIEMLPSGNYEIVVDVRSRNNELLAVKRCFFQRSNSIAEPPSEKIENIDIENSFVANFSFEEIQYQLRTIKPIASINENKTIKFLSSGNNPQIMKQFYLNFWMKKNKSEPEKAWREYQALIEQANKSYSSNLQYGFESDRGRVFLQYGSPNQVQIVPYEPGANPYEIWQYYTTKIGQNNVRFIFMNAERATNNYKLIHSTALGEIYNNQWQQLVYSTFTGGNIPTDDNQKNYRDYYGTRSNIIYNE